MKAPNTRRVLAVIVLLSGAHYATRAMEGEARTGPEAETMQVKRDLLNKFQEALQGREAKPIKAAKAIRLIQHPEFEIDLTDELGMSALIWATIEGFPGVVARLRELGANPNIQDGLVSYTALMYAVSSGDEDSVRELLHYGEDIDLTLTGNDGRTALNLAQDNPTRPEIIGMLQSSADIRFEEVD